MQNDIEIRKVMAEHMLENSSRHHPYRQPRRWPPLPAMAVLAIVAFITICFALNL